MEKPLRGACTKGAFLLRCNQGYLHRFFDCPKEMANAAAPAERIQAQYTPFSLVSESSLTNWNDEKTVCPEIVSRRPAG